MKRLILSVFIMIFLLGFANYSSASTKQFLENELVPDISGYDLDGNYLKNVVTDNTPAFIYFMSPDCEECRILTGVLRNTLTTNEQWRPNIIIITRGNKQKISDIVSEFKKLCTKVTVIHDQNKDAIDLYQVSSYPVLLFVDNSLRVKWSLNPTSFKTGYKNLTDEFKLLFN